MFVFFISFEPVAMHHTRNRIRRRQYRDDWIEIYIRRQLSPSCIQSAAVDCSGTRPGEDAGRLQDAKTISLICSSSRQHITNHAVINNIKNIHYKSTNRNVLTRPFLGRQNRLSMILSWHNSLGIIIGLRKGNLMSRFKRKCKQAIFKSVYFFILSTQSSIIWYRHNA